MRCVVCLIIITAFMSFLTRVRMFVMPFPYSEWMLGFTATLIHVSAYSHVPHPDCSQNTCEPNTSEQQVLSKCSSSICNHSV